VPHLGTGAQVILIEGILWTIESLLRLVFHVVMLGLE
jgi:hypothetical protein